MKGFRQWFVPGPVVKLKERHLLHNPTVYAWIVHVAGDETNLVTDYEVPRYRDRI